jgi:His/Glu/Gln/Arg/opine family amino acid ABC transporter permease subunit
VKILFLIFISLFISSCSSEYNWGWYILDPTLEQGLSNLYFLISGFWLTISISLTSILISLISGFLVAILGFSKNKFLRIINRIYIEFFRAIPLLVLLLWIYYGLPVVFGLTIGAFAAGVISLSLSDSAFEAEIFRAGIQSVSIGQKDAAKSIGLNKYQEMKFIIFPQAVRVILPAIGNQFVYVLKMSSLVSIIGLADLTRKANELVVTVYRPLEIYSFLVIEYLFLIIIISYLIRKLESRLKI